MQNETPTSNASRSDSAPQCEAHVTRVLEHTLNTAACVRALPGNESARLLTFWDFDGTFLRGDCSEGFEVHGESVYPGLAALAIEHGLSSIYERNQVAQFWNHYRQVLRTEGELPAYVHIPLMLAGSAARDIADLATAHFESTLQHHYFASSVAVLRRFEEEGIECHFVSASAQLFVVGAAPTLRLDVDRFNGIEVLVEKGRVANRLVEPVTYGRGKVEKIRHILASANKPGRPAFIVAGFGNSFATDGPFLEYIARTPLPTGRPLAVMINGGPEPGDIRGLFTCVEQTLLHKPDCNR